MKNIITGLLSKAFKLDDGKIAEILKDGEENANESEILKSILELDADRVAQFKKQNADNKESFQQGYAKAKKEEREKFESEIKEEFGIDSDTTGTNLITELVNQRTAEAAKKGEFSEDDVKKHSAYLTLEKSLKKQLTEQKTEYEKKIEEMQTSAKKDSTFAVIRENANAVLESFNPIFAKNKNVAANIKNQFLNELKGYDYDQQPDGSWLVTKDGKVIDDAHGHSKSFEDIVRSVSENYFDFAENNGGSNAGNQNRDDRSGSGGTAPRFKNQSEADAYSLNEAIPLDQRIKAMEDWNSQNSNQ